MISKERLRDSDRGSENSRGDCSWAKSAGWNSISQYPSEKGLCRPEFGLW